MKEKDYLIEFTYDYYCQGYEEAQKTVLVRASNLQNACGKIISSKKYTNPRDFYDLTIE